jgi:hypothetical protein
MRKDQTSYDSTRAVANFARECCGKEFIRRLECGRRLSGMVGAKLDVKFSYMGHRRMRRRTVCWDNGRGLLCEGMCDLDMTSI